MTLSRVLRSLRRHYRELRLNSANRPRGNSRLSPSFLALVGCQGCRRESRRTRPIPGVFRPLRDLNINLNLTLKNTQPTLLGPLNRNASFAHQCSQPLQRYELGYVGKSYVSTLHPCIDRRLSRPLQLALGHYRQYHGLFLVIGDSADTGTLPRGPGAAAAARRAVRDPSRRGAAGMAYHSPRLIASPRTTPSPLRILPPFPASHAPIAASRCQSICRERESLFRIRAHATVKNAYR